uniref:Intronic ORF n=1 Tax=Flammulina velutipes TaxID=38945 RepID=M9MU37_FLAVE|nr:intronic ORF [Flammulina velutipes]AEO19630.1 intronic ORF [Flammulina velutipes]AEO19662.1 intronic ORF [Flammulina velutipes]AEO19693.1 intronic ORF [Flammulina velutipes]
MFSVLIINLSTGVKFLNSDFNILDNPLLIDAFILIIWCNPSIDRWALFFIIVITCLKRKKSSAFWVNSGYFSKCLIIKVKSLIESTDKFTMFRLVFLCIEPIPPQNCCNCNNKEISHICKPNWNLGWIRQPKVRFIFLSIIIENEPSASIRPVTNQGLISAE